MRPSGIFKELWAILMAGTLVTACNSVPVRFGPQEGEEYDVTQPRAVSGEACGFQLLFFIPIRINSRAARAFAALRQEAGKDYIADIKVQEEWTYAFPGTLYCTYMEATAYPRGKT